MEWVNWIQSNSNGLYEINACDFLADKLQIKSIQIIISLNQLSSNLISELIHFNLVPAGRRKQAIYIRYHIISRSTSRKPAPLISATVIATRKWREHGEKSIFARIRISTSFMWESHRLLGVTHLNFSLGECGIFDVP